MFKETTQSFWYWASHPPPLSLKRNDALNNISHITLLTYNTHFPSVNVGGIFFLQYYTQPCYLFISICIYIFFFFLAPYISVIPRLSPRAQSQMSPCYIRFVLSRVHAPLFHNVRSALIKGARSHLGCSRVA